MLYATAAGVAPHPVIDHINIFAAFCAMVAVPEIVTPEPPAIVTVFAPAESLRTTHIQVKEPDRDDANQGQRVQRVVADGVVSVAAAVAVDLVIPTVWRAVRLPVVAGSTAIAVQGIVPRVEIG